VAWMPTCGRSPHRAMRRKSPMATREEAGMVTLATTGVNVSGRPLARPNFSTAASR